MTKDEILRGMEAMQRIQQQNPPTSERWQRASVALHKLGAMLNQRLKEEREAAQSHTQYCNCEACKAAWGEVEA